MRIIISPAKKMNIDTDSLPYTSMPQFLSRTKEIRAALQNLSDDELQKLWKCNDSIASLNISRLRNMDLSRDLTPAVLSYEGIQYRYMGPGVFTYGQLDYITEHLRILSGFYGLLQPFDGVAPYRLEMQAKLRVSGSRDLYDFWGDAIGKQLSLETDFVLNLASKEYSRAVLPHLNGSVKVLTCIFGEMVNGRVTEKGTACKMARGDMVRWLAENDIKNPNDIKNYDGLGYSYCEKYSDLENLCFIKGEK